MSAATNYDTVDQYRQGLSIERSLVDSPAFNQSGLVPLGHAVLVKPYQPEIKRGMIHIPDTVIGGMQVLDQRATVVAIGPLAWKDEEARARPGDKVLVTKFAGFMAGEGLTKDKQMYRIVNDRDIFCRIDWSD